MILMAQDPRGLKENHPTLINLRVQKRIEKMPRARQNTTVPSDPIPDPDTPGEDPLIGDLIDTEEDSDYIHTRSR